MATPKYKTSKSRAASRKAANMKLKAPNLVECQTCGNLIPSHRVCPKCGYYAGKSVVAKDEE